MLVYGWPILAKVASFGWNKHRSGVTNQSIRSSEVNKFLETLWRFLETKGDTDGGILRGHLVMEGGLKETSFLETSLTRRWDAKEFDSSLLSRWAVGVMRTFRNLESVNQRPSLRGFKFSSKYVGDKTIAWFFETEYEREGFISNRFFWDDAFSTMSRWNDHFTPKTRLVWMNVSGIPLKVWCYSFFMKVGESIGKPLLVEEDSNADTVRPPKLLHD
ncbi:hypothetical protein Q3G72_017400 [Acer saccharum]|nr:hypothetical protein Q3G72_017400 [Acer saccharum]